MNFNSARKARQIHAELKAEGKPLGMRDVMISAITINEGYTIVTRNVAHLSKIEELNLMPVP